MSDVRPGYSRLTLTNEPSSLSLAVSHAHACAENLGFEATAVAEIELGVEEAAANVIKHAYPAGTLATYDIITQPTTLGLSVSIHDTGTPFAPEEIPDYHPETPLADQTGAGLGTYLLKSSFDEIHHCNLGKQGHRLDLVKYRPGDDIRQAPAAAPPSAERDDSPVAVRAFRAEDANAVARCVFHAYGYSYVYEHIYFPDRLTALNHEGTWVSAVAVTDDGRVAGHAALVRSIDHPGLAELAVVVTSPAFRERGIASHLAQFLLDGAKRMALDGVFVMGVTSHTFTQRFCTRLGFRDCALLLSIAPSSMSFHGIAEHLRQRESCVLGYQALKPAPERPFYIPPQHADMARELFHGLGLNIQAAAGISPSAAHSQLQENSSAELSVARIHFDRIGLDARQNLRQRLIDARRRHTDTIVLFLNLADPATPWLAEGAEELGFFFTGVFPLPSQGDRLVYQYLNDLDFDHSRLQLLSPNVEVLRRYVADHDPNRA